MFDLVWIVHPSIEVAFQLGIPLVTMPFLVNLDPAEASQRQRWLRRHIFFFGWDQVRFCMLRKYVCIVFVCWDIKIYETFTWILGDFGDLDLFIVCGSEIRPRLMYQKGASGIFFPKIRVQCQGLEWFYPTHVVMIRTFHTCCSYFWPSHGIIGCLLRDGWELKQFFGIFIPIFLGWNSLQFWRPRIFFTWVGSTQPPTWRVPPPLKMVQLLRNLGAFCEIFWRKIRPEAVAKWMYLLWKWNMEMDTDYILYPF